MFFKLMVSVFPECVFVVCLLKMLITASQIQWTTDVTRSLITSKERADKSSLKSMKKKQV